MGNFFNIVLPISLVFTILPMANMLMSKFLTLIFVNGIPYCGGDFLELNFGTSSTAVTSIPASKNYEI